MFDYLDKFNKLNPNLKSAVSNPQVISIIENLEAEFNVDLASLIMKIMIKEIDVNRLPLIISSEFNLDQDKSKLLAQKITEEILIKVADYLSLDKPKVNTPKVDILKVDTPINPVSAEVIKILNLNFKSDDSKSRFLSVLDKYIIGVKDRFSVRQILIRDVSEGGFGLPDKMVDNIFMVASSIADKNGSKIKQDLKVEPDILRKIERLGHGQISSGNKPKLLPEKEEVLELAPVESIPKLEEKPENLKAVFEDLKKINEKEETHKEVPVEPIKVEETKLTPPPLVKPEAPKTKPIINMPVSGNGKIKMSDVKKITITGPIDELKFMNLVNFRRLASNPDEAFLNIKQKLKNLENIDYGKMLEGIKAWRQNPINRLYLKIFSQASNEGMSINQVIEKLKNSGQDYLTYEEIEALIKFNRSLMF
ncbi:MAG TPA: hypothetical protein PLE28_01315 [bacterium]|nr:hypothetical protein [bacterium]